MRNSKAKIQYNELKDQAQIHDEKESLPSNQSNNRPFEKILQTALPRRGVVKGSLAGAATSFLAPQAIANDGPFFGSGRNRELVRFQPLTIEEAIVDDTMPSISADYQYQVLIPWGTPIEPGATEEFTGDPNNRPTSQQAALQIGIGHDGMWFFPRGRDGNAQQDREFTNRFNRSSDPLANRRGMLCVNHEFGTNFHVLGKGAPESLEDVRISQSVHGVSVVAIEAKETGWEVVSSPNSRRITVNTPMRFSGPAADSPLLQNPNGNIPLGTVNNCGSGKTPWGTYLTCEENFNGYFGSTLGEVFNDTRTEEQLRYGFDFDGFGYGWYNFDRRFDLSDPDYVNESNRFGWIVEIDPMDGTQMPVKRTALGRFKHEAIAIAESSTGRVAAFMGDDQRFDYCYKYLSDLPWRTAIEQGKSPLDEGQLFVARFNDDGTGEWLPLTIENPLLADRFANQAELLINVRIAADLLGATPMDRPEWTTIGKDGEVYWTLTNNSQRTVPDAANPEAPNSDGHIIRTTDSDDYLGTSFTWEIFILASSTRGTPGVFTDPDAAYADPEGRLFIGTDGGQPDGLQDQLVVLDTTSETPVPKRLLTGVASDEITGFTVTPNFRTAFINIQHPGNGDPSATNFPQPFNGTTIPRDATLVITRKNRGIIGS
ncbi:MAG: PhoX family phosphatase [Pseudomonadota bacterium]